MWVSLVGHPGFAPFPAAVAPTIPMTVPTFSAVTSRKFGGNTSGGRGGEPAVWLHIVGDYAIQRAAGVRSASSPPQRTLWSSVAMENPTTIDSSATPAKCLLVRDEDALCIHNAGRFAAARAHAQACATDGTATSIPLQTRPRSRWHCVPRFRGRHPCRRSQDRHRPQVGPRDPVLT